MCLHGFDDFLFTFFVRQTQLSQLSIQSHWQQHGRPTIIYLYGKREKKDFSFKKVVHSEPSMPTKPKMRFTYFVSILLVTSVITRAHWVSDSNVSISVCFHPLLYFFASIRFTELIPFQCCSLLRVRKLCVYPVSITDFWYLIYFSLHFTAYYATTIIQTIYTYTLACLPFLLPLHLSNSIVNHSLPFRIRLQATCLSFVFITFTFDYFFCFIHSAAAAAAASHSSLICSVIY